jgi:hypothetical protein
MHTGTAHKSTFQLTIQATHNSKRQHRKHMCLQCTCKCLRASTGDTGNHVVRSGWSGNVCRPIQFGLFLGYAILIYQDILYIDGGLKQGQNPSRHMNDNSTKYLKWLTRILFATEALILLSIRLALPFAFASAKGFHILLSFTSHASCRRSRKGARPTSLRALCVRLCPRIDKALYQVLVAL